MALFPFFGLSVPVPTSLSAPALFAYGAASCGLYYWGSEDENRRREAQLGLDPNLPKSYRTAVRQQAHADYEALVRQRQAEYDAGRRSWD